MIFRDRTERRALERVLRESDARARALLEGLAQATWETDAEGVAIADSPSWRAYTGQPLEEWLGHGWIEAVHPADRAHAEREWRGALAAQRIFNAEFRIRSPEGRHRWTNVRAMPLLDERGAIRKWIGLNMDIDARKTAEERIRRKNAVLEGINRIFREALSARSEEELGQLCLEIAEGVTGAAFSFMAEVNGVTGRLDELSISPGGWAAFSMEDPAYPRGRAPTGLPVHGIYGRVLKEGRGRIVNDPAHDPDRVGVPKGHPPLRAFLGVPLLHQGRTVGMIGLGNRPGGFRPEDLESAEALAPAIWQALLGKRTADALRRSEERLRLFGEASSDILWIRDAETLHLHYLTPACEEIYGITLAEALAGDNHRRWLDFVVPADRAHVLEALRRVREGAHVTFEYRLRRAADGSLRWLRSTAFPIAGEAGEVRLIGGIGRDMTKRQETELRLRSLIEGIPQLVWRTDDGGRWTWASPQWTSYTGLSEAESAGHGWLAALHPEDREPALAFWRSAPDSGRLEMNGRLRRGSDGSFRWFQSRATAVRDAHGAILEWLGTSTDVEDLRQLQEHQSVLIHEVQHRTRNLIGVVRSLVDRTLEGAVSLEDFHARIRDRLGALARVNSLLSRLDEGDKIAFDELLQAELAAHGAVQDGAGRQLTLEGPPGVRLRSTTVQIFALALHELATNAVKYGALATGTGHLAIRWRVAVEDRQKRLVVDWRETGVADMPSAGAAPQGGGFGRQLIEKALPYQLKARTSYALQPDGVHCVLDLPVAADRKETKDV
ncbi:hypothetical protein GCM10011390_29450 [Aureimonas endophytica]|uniref:Blue-light-activated histidine kinase n=1 Tax=Aureimonas endophytica TaxID=2027858 RepID=A0A916ZPZ5_9HYPH|nr:PAS domain-containing protein [Aureimonas endophytica]GGE08471.1 hypothetical protein GCM10011390_29450 [Aureimonas endophytica]